MSPRFLVASLLLLLFAIYLVEPRPASESETWPSEEGLGGPPPPGSPAGSPAVTAIDCGAACAVRCSKASRQNLCHRACGTCCARCHCVPSGTSGNYDECPCYANQTTHGGRRKCP